MRQIFFIASPHGKMFQLLDLTVDNATQNNNSSWEKQNDLTMQYMPQRGICQGAEISSSIQLV
jgi:hypothetical protein